MNTTTLQHAAGTARRPPTDHTSLWRRVFGVIARPQSYRNIAYLLLGLPLGTVWFSVIVSGVATGVSMLVVALLGIPMLLGLWYVARVCANVERATANALLGSRLPSAPVTSSRGGTLWSRLRATTGERDRWRELWYLLLRFPVGIATFTVAAVALAVPFFVTYAPFDARYGGDHPFGDWVLSARMEHALGSGWAWLLVPLGAALLIASFHLMNAIAGACRRWTTSWLGDDAPRDSG